MDTQCSTVRKGVFVYFYRNKECDHSWLPIKQEKKIDNAIAELKELAN